MADAPHRSSQASSSGSGPAVPGYGETPQSPPPPPPVYAQPPAAKSGGRPLRTIGTTLVIAVVMLSLGFYAGLFTSLTGGKGLVTSEYQEGEGDERIAIIPVRGLIGDETAGFVRAAVNKVIADESIKAVVLRVESGGGFVAPSEEIYHQLERLKQERAVPVIASYGGMAASGGYYISCNADYIYAQPTGITGSIGVIAQLADVSGALRAMHIEPKVIVADTSPNKDLANDILTGWQEEDTAELKKTPNAMHARFTEIVRQGRGEVMSEQQFAEATRGNAYMAEEALALKLIDGIGYLEDAIVKARDEAGIGVAKPPVVLLQTRPTFLQSLGLVQSAGPNVSLDGDSLRRMAIELSRPELMYWHRW